jgi:hypothetical protein
VLSRERLTIGIREVRLLWAVCILVTGISETVGVFWVVWAVVAEVAGGFDEVVGLAWVVCVAAADEVAAVVDTAGLEQEATREAVANTQTRRHLEKAGFSILPPLPLETRRLQGSSCRYYTTGKKARNLDTPVEPKHDKRGCQGGVNSITAHLPVAYQ